MKNWEGKKMVCIDRNGIPLQVGDTVTCFRGETYTVRSFEPPHKPSASGRVYVEGGTGYYAKVFGCKYVEDTLRLV